ncbi:MAG: Bax inhibitor-1/YccA family protein [Pseudomonadales bacterium]|nr:Bax inhibitor-1/YccA family protein [Pseudomonadales bacterium]
MAAGADSHYLNSGETAVERNAAGQKVLANTYRLLAMTLLFSGITAMSSAALNLPHPGLIITLVGYFGLLFLVSSLKNSAWGIGAVFALTGFMGYTLGPVLNQYLSLPGGSGIVATAFTVTAVVFTGLSMFARTTSMSFLNAGNFLFIGILTAFLLGLAAVFFEMPGLALAVSGLFVLLMSGLILYETQNILAGGETNYIMATVSLYVAIFNLFTSLLHLLGVLGNDE